MAHADQPTSYIWTDIGRLLRYWWVVLLVAAAAGAIALLLARDQDDEARARQAMSLVDAEWSDIQTAHELNASWVQDVLPESLLAIDPTGSIRVELERPGEPQATAFFLVATAADPDAARAAADVAVSGLTEHQQIWAEPLEEDRQALSDRRDQTVTELTAVEAEVAQLRADRDRIEAAEGYTAEVDALGGEIALAEQRRRQIDADLAVADDQLAQLDQRAAVLPTVAAVGEQRIETDSPSLSRQTIGLLAAFGGALIASIAVLAWDRRWGKLSNEAQLTRMIPDHPVADINRGAGATAALAELAAAARRLVDTRASGVTIVGSTPDADGRRIAGMLRAELQVYGDDDSIEIIAGSGEEAGLLLRSAALTGRAIVIVAHGSRGSHLLATLKRLDQLQVEVLLVALAGRSRGGTRVTLAGGGPSIEDHETDRPAPAAQSSPR